MDDVPSQRRFVDLLRTPLTSFLREARRNWIWDDQRRGDELFARDF